MSKPHFLILLLILCCNNVFLRVQAKKKATINAHAHVHVRGVAQFELIHRHAPQLSNLKGDGNGNTLGPPKSRLDRLKLLIHSDNVRQQTITHRLGRRRKTFEIRSRLVDIPIRSAADTGIGQYLVSLRVGSPHPQKFVVIADTGSDLTWMNCYYKCKHCPKTSPHPGRTLRANTSLSFRTIPCSSDICKVDLADSFSLALCPVPHAPCLYDYRYADGSRVVGVFANETVTVGLHNGQKIRLRDVLIGCSESFNGTFYDSDGVMGLGYNKHSFAVKVAAKFGDKFSYCLVDHLSPSNLVNYLSFGNIKDSTSLKMQYTELLLGYVNPYYAVNVSGISVGGTMVKISPQVWDVRGDGGVILDSGSSLTFLVQPAYEAVINAFNGHLTKFKKVELNMTALDYCFEDKGYEESLVPNLVIHFADGVQFVPPIKSYVIDAADGVKCLALSPTDWPGTSVIGNIMQQNYLWEFDLGASKLGFASSACTALTSKH